MCYFLAPLCSERPCGEISVSTQQKLAWGPSNACCDWVPQIANFCDLNVAKGHGVMLTLENVAMQWFCETKQTLPES